LAEQSGTFSTHILEGLSTMVGASRGVRLSYKELLNARATKCANLLQRLDGMVFILIHQFMPPVADFTEKFVTVGTKYSGW
jgi:hypothetical protein